MIIIGETLNYPEDLVLSVTAAIIGTPKKKETVNLQAESVWNAFSKQKEIIVSTVNQDFMVML